MAAHLKRISIIGGAVLLCATRVCGGGVADVEPTAEAEMWMMGASMMEEDMMEVDESTTEGMSYMMGEEEEEEEMKDASTTDGESMTTMEMDESTTREEMGDDDDDDSAPTTKMMMMTSTMAEENMPTVQGSLTIQGLSYPQVVADPNLKAGVIAGCKTAVADAAGAEVSPEDVTCTLSEGSVQVDFSITPPEGVDASTLADGINGTALGTAMISEVEAVDGIDAATTGPLAAANVTVQPVVASTTSSMMGEAGTTSEMAAATTRESEVHQTSGAGDRKMLPPVLAFLCASAFPL